jgi:hypothetical protein
VYDIVQAGREAAIRTMLRETQSDHPDEQNGLSSLHNFSKVWSHVDVERGGVNETVPADLHNESMELARKQQKAGSSIAAAGLQLQMSEGGDITIIQSGSHYILIPANQAQEFRAAVNALVPAADLPTDANRTALPKTSLQLSQDQNAKVAAFIKQRQLR